ncbi:cytochrome c oxidase subunit II [Azospirillum sp. TSO22-1]|uniref:cytochrome c oxidase subunit II n=1 Tax=Azospirillum sp. TSO22-1 TaxID=716789 RepID=UPI000D60ED50|nr:cytochrome c oxidase subunit II [Azospirillum sp. TSO22-1]PWC52417.1 cytochrome C oxidase [Azospirillum sp. TSO22-1]
MAVAIVLAALVLVSVLFSVLSPWWFTPLASNWGMIDKTLFITFIITGIVFAAVSLFMAYAVFRFRHRDGAKAAYEPESKRLEIWLTGVTSVGIAAMLAPGLIVWDDYVTVPSEASVVEVVGQQWNWTFRLPGADGVLGTVDARRIGSDNPFGLNPDDPKGQDDVLVNANELRLPVGHPVKVVLRSIDVLHDFFVPQIRAKMDLVPGMVTYFWFTPEKVGTYEILCAELCGAGHSAMRGTVTVVEEAEYQPWLRGLPTFAQSQAGNGPGRRRDLAQDAGAPR